MKIRNGFVSNSSSSSFAIMLKKENSSTNETINEMITLFKMTCGVSGDITSELGAEDYVNHLEAELISNKNTIKEVEAGMGYIKSISPEVNKALNMLHNISSLATLFRMHFSNYKGEDYNKALDDGNVLYWWEQEMSIKLSKHKQRLELAKLALIKISLKLEKDELTQYDFIKVKVDNSQIDKFTVALKRIEEAGHGFNLHKTRR